MLQREGEPLNMIQYIHDMAAYMAAAETGGAVRDPPDFLMRECPRCFTPRPVLTSLADVPVICPSCAITAYLKHRSVPLARTLAPMDVIDRAQVLMSEQLHAAVDLVLEEATGLRPVPGMLDWRRVTQFWSRPEWHAPAG